MRVLLIALGMALLVTFRAQAGQECGIGDAPCEIALGQYNIELPQTPQRVEKIPAMIYFHGAGGSGERAMKNRNMVETFLNRGYAVIAPSGLKRPHTKWGPGWSFHPNRPKQRDELKFAHAVLADTVKRFNVDRDKVLMTGFSIGGSLVWYMACDDPSVASAYAPVAGAFWRPHPVAENCKGPLNMLHTHGWRDGTVPLEGRVIGNGAIVQGDVFHSLQIARQLNGCDNHKADRFASSAKLWKRWWIHCTSGKALQFNMYDGGHRVPKDWAKEALDWFEALDKPKQG